MERQQDTNCEIGAARQDELDSILNVMCAAFELPFAVARPIFFADPYLKLENKRVVRVEGRIVACLTITELTCRIGSSEVAIAGIAGVATLPKYQRQGYASRLLNSTVEVLRSRGVSLAGLFPYQSDYYRRLGWETAGSLCRYVTTPACLPEYVEAAQVLTAETADFEAIANLYAQTLGSLCLSAVRDAARWQYARDRVQAKKVYSFRGKLEGYLFYDVQPGTIRLGSTEADTPPTIRILEMVALTPRARYALLGYLSRKTQIGRIEYEANWEGLRAAGLLDIPWIGRANADYGTTTSNSRAISLSKTVAHVEILSGLMLRVIDFYALLQMLQSNWGGWGHCQGAIELKLLDDNHPGSSQSIFISGRNNGHPGVLLQQASSSHCTDSEIVGSIEGDLRVWAQVAVGHMSGSEACSLGLLHASTPDAVEWLGCLFPSRSPSLLTLDHF